MCEEGGLCGHWLEEEAGADSRARPKLFKDARPTPKANLTKHQIFKKSGQLPKSSTADNFKTPSDNKPDL